MDVEYLDGALNKARTAQENLLEAARSLRQAAADAAWLLDACARSLPDRIVIDPRLEAKRWRAISDESARFIATWNPEGRIVRPPFTADPTVPLTEGELEIVRWLPSRLGFAELAVQLGTSVEVVKARALAVYRKLGAASRADAVARASALGIFRPSQSRSG